MQNRLSVSIRDRILQVVCFGLMFGSLGCQQRVSSELLGQWIGRPDTAAARAQRETQRYGGPASAEEDNIPATTSPRKTDWESFDVVVALNILSSSELEMSLEGGSEPRRGSWRILDISTTGCTIEIQTESKTELNASGDAGQTTNRRFDLELDQREGELVGFLMTEVGADRELGAIYFSRP